MRDVYKNTGDYNLGRECKLLIVFDDMIADMINNKKLNPIVTELFIRGRKLYISIVFITQSYFKVPKNENSKRKRTSNQDIHFKDFIKIYKECTKEPYSCLVNDTTLQSDNPL